MYSHAFIFLHAGTSSYIILASHHRMCSRNVYLVKTVGQSFAIGPPRRTLHFSNEELWKCIITWIEIQTRYVLFARIMFIRISEICHCLLLFLCGTIYIYIY